MGSKTSFSLTVMWLASSDEDCSLNGGAFTSLDLYIADSRVVPPARQSQNPGKISKHCIFQINI